MVMSKKEAQKRLDKIARGFGLRSAFRGGGGLMLLLGWCGGFAFSGRLWLIVPAFILAVPLTLLLLKWYRRTPLRTHCPRCGGELKVRRETADFTDTVISCESCKLESDQAQIFEDNIPG